MNNRHTNSGSQCPSGSEAAWDIVITLCDRARKSCPNLPSRPVTVHWGIPDPGDAVGGSRRSKAFEDTLALLSWRIDRMLALCEDLLERLVIEQRLTAITVLAPATDLTPPTGAR